MPNDKNNPQNGVQRRHVTILYSDICDSTYLGESTDPENAAHVVRTVKSVAKQIVAEFGGHVTQFHGDGILAIFGYPNQREGEGEQATRAALDLHAAVRALQLESYLPNNFTLRMHTGIESGLTLIDQGDYLDGTFELVGDAVNTAAKLSGAAQTDEILVSTATLSGRSPFFVTEEKGPITLKGKTSPVSCYKILGHTNIRTRFEASRERGLTAFCGRENELNQLDDLLHRSQTGELRVVQIVGEPGMGKTRLIEEFLHHAVEQGSVVHRGNCEFRGEIAPLHPFLQIVRNHFERNADGPANLEFSHKQLPRLLADTADKSGTANKPEDEAIESVLSSWFTRHAQDEAMVIVIDDWQWIDDASRKVFSQLVRDGLTAKMMIVIATRNLGPEHRVSGLTDVISLDPIREDETAFIVQTLLPDYAELGIVQNLHRKSGGNPLFLEELCLSFNEWRAKERDSTASGVVPATLQDLIESRIQRLPKDYIDLVHTAAVIGNIVPQWLMARVTNQKQNTQILQFLADTDVLYQGTTKGTLQFKHGITRETIYATVGLQRRRALHNKIARILEEESNDNALTEQYERLAYHYAGGATYDKALDYAEQAGDKALASSSLDRARQQFETALDAIDHLPDATELRQRWISISGRWALPCVYGPQASQLDILQRTVDYAQELGDLTGLADAYYWQGYISYVLGDQPASIAFYKNALRTARKTNNERQIAQITATLGQSYAAASNYSEALGYIEQAIAEKSRHPGKSSVRVGSSYALSVKSLILGDQGHFVEAHRCSQQAHDAVRGRNHEIESSILNNHSVVHIWQGNWREALALTTRSKGIAEHVSAPYLFACALALHAYADWKQNQNPAAIDTLRQIIAWVEDKGMFLYSSLFYAWIADALCEEGHFQEARHYAEGALARAHLQDRVGDAPAYRSLALAANREHRHGLQSPDVYLELAAQAADFRNAHHEKAKNQLLQAKFYLEERRTDDAVVLLQQAYRAFAEMGCSGFVAEVEHIQATLP